jgi:hypothetical protein
MHKQENANQHSDAKTLSTRKDPPSSCTVHRLAFTIKQMQQATATSWLLDRWSPWPLQACNYHDWPKACDGCCRQQLPRILPAMS